jgi:hypothetical protein
VKLTGKSGRGISVFLRYLIFHILLSARAKNVEQEAKNPEHIYNPTIVYMQKGDFVYVLTKDSIAVHTNLMEALLKHKRPHYLFADNVDVDDLHGTEVTMALSSGDADVLKTFTKRMNESYKPTLTTRHSLVMPGLDLQEMCTVFGSMPPDEVRFRYDVVGGNPRLAFAEMWADIGSPYYPVVRSVVERLFVGDTEGHLTWATNVVCAAVDRATTGRAEDALDSSTFRDFEVVKFDGRNTVFREVFASTFMGIVAAKVYSMSEETTIATLLRLSGGPLATASSSSALRRSRHWEASCEEMYYCIPHRLGLAPAGSGGGRSRSWSHCT